MTIVIDLDHLQQRVRLRSPGFESSVVVASGFRSGLRLAHYYRRPHRVKAKAFVDELLALSLEPPRSAAEVAVLPAQDRAKLRVAVVKACERQRDWRALHGSHLTADERLFAVMYWRRRGQGQARARLQAQASTHLASVRQAVTADVVERLGLTSVPAVPSPIELALGDVGAELNVAQAFSPTSAGAIKALEAQSVLSRDLAKRLEAPLSGVLDHFKRMSSVTSVFDNTKALDRSLGLGNLSVFARAGIASSVVGGFDTSLSAVAVGAPFGQFTKMSAAAKPLAWSAPVALADVVGRWERGSASVAAMAGLLPELPSVSGLLSLGQLGTAWDALAKLQRVGEPLRELTEAVETVDQFDRRWQNEALYFILSGFLVVCSLWEMHKLAALDRDGVEEAVLLALEAVMRDGKFILALREAVRQAPYLNSSQRTNLDHALEHAAQNEYVHACASLYWGLEGSFWEVGVVKAVVTVQRTDPRNTNRSIGFESMVKRLGLGPELKTFMVRGLYGTTGNPYRHGGADSGERRQVLLGIAALAGWFEEFTKVKALTELVTRTGRALPVAVEQVLQGPQLLGSGG